MNTLLPMLDGHNPQVRRPFGDRPIWCRSTGGTAHWLTPRQMGLDEATIAAVEALEAEGDAASQPAPTPVTAPEPAPEPPARTVFGRMSERDGRTLARQATEARQEALL